MKPSRFFTYAGLAVLAAAGAIWYIVSDYYARQEAQKEQLQVSADVVMYKNAGCQCCDRWAQYMQRNNYSVKVVKVSNLQAVKVDKGVPADMASCHTAVIDDYVVEGHVPVVDIERMLKNRSDAVGIAAPGMPESSPGMNTALNKPYSVYQFDRQGQSELFANH